MTTSPFLETITHANTIIETIDFRSHYTNFEAIYEDLFFHPDTEEGLVRTVFTTTQL